MKLTEWERGVMLIEKLAPQINLHYERALKEHPDWRTNRGDYKQIFWLAKKVLDSGIYLSIESVGIGGMDGSQVITQGRIQIPGKYHIDYNVVLEKAVQRAYERQQRDVPDTEEQRRIIKQYFDEQDNQDYKKEFEDLKEKLSNLNTEFIKNRLRSKLEDYLMSKSV